MAYSQPTAGDKEDAKIKRFVAIGFAVVILVLAAIFHGQIHDMIYPTHQAPAADG